MAVVIMVVVVAGRQWDTGGMGLATGVGGGHPSRGQGGERRVGESVEVEEGKLLVLLLPLVPFVLSIPFPSLTSTIVFFFLSIFLFSFYSVFLRV